VEVQTFKIGDIVSHIHESEIRSYSQKYNIECSIQKLPENGREVERATHFKSQNLQSSMLVSITKRCTIGDQIV